MRKLLFVLLFSLVFCVSNSLQNKFEKFNDTDSTFVESLSNQAFNLSDESALLLNFSSENINYNSSSRQLKKLIHIQRHGARTSEREGMELTEKGKEQLRIVGQKIFEKYSSHVQNSSEFFQNIQVYSTNYNRTIQSAKFFLLGLYESQFKHEEKDQNFDEIFIDNLKSLIQIYKTNYNSDILLNGWRQNECIKQKELVKIQINSPFFKQMFSFLYPIVSDISALTNTQINTFYDAYLLYDEIISSQIEGNISEPLQMVLANQTLFNTLRFMNDFSAIYTFYGSPLQVKITTQTLMLKILEIFSSSPYSLLSPSLTVFSAHDITLDGIFAALNLTNPRCLIESYYSNEFSHLVLEYPYLYTPLEVCISSPSFAANIQIELYDDNSIQFVYNNKIYNIPSLSSLEELNNFVQSFYLGIDSQFSCSSESHKNLRHHQEEIKSQL
ncbi:histidine phosphatase family (branch 2) protein (macronuclear) [Tetrahymena thermophila SB210]|uniref:Histidine phosphatase family (Branch 2) protein n=1 Tax=Tetrahymena thermophila (strain SB210) TaxID=312017 RepID=Q22YQ9_TETTS|nr:histidine phosphatase family (branch 2) protein [Tetrahymena thermophila SB210]EAR90612.1 histidine phosphatase family (branch 2) protein [Tetrahymena thermophila SB210]|eukprot:XP_001010857.1 histidine phosphatase family (branch 2) protein [Tetrahymena thermophila SB210]